MKRLMLREWVGGVGRAMRGTVTQGMLAGVLALPVSAGLAGAQPSFVPPFPVGPGTAAPQAGRMTEDWKKAEADKFLSPEIRQAFPHLGSDFEILGPSTQDENAFSHALGEHGHWVTPPQVGTGDNPLADADRIFAEAGYMRLPVLDVSLQPGKQKVVLYGTLTPDGGLKEITSAALQEPDGTWSSKVGGLALIRHQTPEALRGPNYGLPIAVYVRAAR